MWQPLVPQKLSRLALILCVGTCFVTQHPPLTPTVDNLGHLNKLTLFLGQTKNCGCIVVIVNRPTKAMPYIGSHIPALNSA